MRTRPLLAALAVVLLASPAIAASERARGGAADRPPTGKLPAGVAPKAYAVELKVDPRLERFSGSSVIEVRLDRPTRTIWMHGEDLNVQSVDVEHGGKRVRGAWEQVDQWGLAAVRFPLPVGPGDVSLRFTWDAAFDRGLRGLYKVVEGGDSYAFTQMEATSARRAMPCFDEPRFKTPFDVALTVKPDHRAVANTTMLDDEPTADGWRRARFQTTRPLPTYLLAWAVGPLDIVEAEPIPPNEVRKHPLPFRGVAAKGKGERLAYALAGTPRILEALERWFGTPYPFDKLDILAVPDFAAGAMENPGAVTFRETLLLVDPKTAPIGQKKAFAGVMAHELAHMWFGDLVTMPWWDDLWLNEAFATWMTFKILEQVHPEYRAELAAAERNLGAFSADSYKSARRIRNPIESNHDIENAFDGITYSKGAAVLGMFERWLTPKAFQEGVRLYMREHAWGSATAGDLLSALSRASGKHVEGPFSTFLDQSGLPLVEATLSCAEGRARLDVRQRRYLPLGSEAEKDRRWKIPLCVRAGMPRGGSSETCALVEHERHQLALPPEACATWAMPNADGDGYYRFAMPEADLRRLVEARAALSPRERLLLVDAVRSAEAAGALPYDQALSLLERSVGDKERAAATAAMGLFLSAREHLVPELREAVDARAVAAYGPVAARLGFEKKKGEDGEQSQLRASVLSFLGLGVEDARVRAELARRGRAYLGLDGAAPAAGATTERVFSDAVDEELVETALAAAVREGGAPVFDHLVARLASERDALLRGRMISALGATLDPTLAAKARALVLDGRLRTNEVMPLLSALLADARVRDDTWAWLEKNLDAVLQRLPGGRQNGALPRLGGRFCDAERARDVERLFKDRVAEMHGGPRNLEAALESIRLCVAHKAGQAENARRAFDHDRKDGRRDRR